MRLNEVELSNFIDIMLYHITPEMYQYMKDCVASGKVLYHGIGKMDAETLYFVGNNIKNRAPKNSSLYIHNLADNYLNKKFGISFRSNSLFTSPKSSHGYGSPYVVLPIKNATYCYSEKIFDLYMTLQSVLTSALDHVEDNLSLDDLPEEEAINLDNNYSKIENFLYVQFDSNPSLSKKDFPELVNRISDLYDVKHETSQYIFDEFLSMLNEKLYKKFETYEVTNTVSDIPDVVKKNNNEVMVHSPKFLFLNNRQVIKKMKKPVLEFFKDIIDRYEKGERF